MPIWGLSCVLPTKVAGHWKGKVTFYSLIAGRMSCVQVLVSNDIGVPRVLAPNFRGSF